MGWSLPTSPALIVNSRRLPVTFSPSMRRSPIDTACGAGLVFGPAHPPTGPFVVKNTSPEGVDPSAVVEVVAGEPPRRSPASATLSGPAKPLRAVVRPPNIPKPKAPFAPGPLAVAGAFLDDVVTPVAGASPNPGAG